MRNRRLRRVSGFTIVETMVVMVIIVILAIFSFPALRQILLRADLESYMTQVRGAMQGARYQAIKLGLPVVVQVLPDTNEIRVYVDRPELDEGGVRVDTDLVYDPSPGLDPRETNEILQLLPMPTRVRAAAPAGQVSVDGFTNLSGGDPSEAEPEELVAVFMPDGSIRDAGAIRLSDRRKNFIEARVEIAATGKMALRKFDCRAGVWRYRDEQTSMPGESAWEWYWNYRNDC